MAVATVVGLLIGEGEGGGRGRGHERGEQREEVLRMAAAVSRGLGPGVTRN